MIKVRGKFVSTVAIGTAIAVSAVAHASDIAPASLQWVVSHDRIAARGDVYFDDVRGARRAIGDGSSIEDVMRALGGLHDLPVRRDIPASGPEIGAVPPSFRRPVSDLMAAAATAEVAARAAIVEEGTPHLRSLTLPQPPAPASQPRPPLVTGTQISYVETVTTDRRGLLNAAGALARAVDDAVDRLTRLTPPPDANSGAPAACDVVDQLPMLCIGNSGKNLYKKDAALLIDLGGNDVYANSAGGADPVSGNGLYVSVNVDLGGNDKYKSALPLGSKARVAQGAGADGGIGILFDTEGDDAYAAASRPKVEPPQSLGGVAQGASYAGGIGVLLDRDGSDTYKLTSGTPGGAAGAFGIGAAAGRGFAALVDAGGDDHFQAMSRPIHYRSSSGVARPDEAVTSALGTSTFGGGSIFYDGGGNDRLSISSLWKIHPTRDEYHRAATAQGIGLGAAIGDGGVALALLGSGEARAAIDARISARIYAIDEGVAAAATGFGFGSTGFGALDDAGGNDQYTMKANGDSQHLGIGAGSAFGMGAGSLGTGMLHDGGGDDRYATDVNSDGYYAAFSGSYAQGAGVLGAGFIRDDAGDDRYDSRTRGHIAFVNPDERWFDGYALSGAQAFGSTGAGQLVDQGGSDVYNTTNTFYLGRPARLFLENPAKRTTTVFSSVQASVETGAARFDDADRTLGDVFKSSPEDLACLGTRGSPTWRDCGDVYGEGTVRDL